jgi:hypothetical protein
MRELLESVAKECKVDVDLLQKIIDYEQTILHLEKRRGAKERLREIIEDHLDGAAS